jgi:hypothetical protein
MSTLDINNLSLNDINVDAVTNTSSTGVFDKLMASVNSNIELQYNEGRITSNDYASVYLGSLQAVLQQSMQFVLQEQLTEVQVASAITDNTLKAKQLEIADIDKQSKQFEFDNLLPEQLIKIQEEIDILQNQDLDLVAKTTIAIAESAKSVLLKQEQIESESLNNGVDGVIANQILDIKKGVDVKERQAIETEATGTKQRILMDEEAETSDLQQIILATEEEIKTAQHLEMVDSTLRANTQLDDSLITSVEQRKGLYTDRLLKDKQSAKLGLDNVMKSSEASRDADEDFVYSPKYTAGT